MSEETQKAEESETEKPDAEPEAASGAAEQPEAPADAVKAESEDKASAKEAAEEKAPEAKKESAASEPAENGQEAGEAAESNKSEESDKSEAKEEPKSEAKEEEKTEAKEQAKPEAKDKSEPAAKDKPEPEAEEKSADGEKAKAEEGEKEKSEALKKAERILREQEGPGGRREAEEDLFEKVVHINRCAKVVKGGRRFSFSALVVSGDKEGQVGLGFGKAQEVAECIRKASDASKKRMVKVKITENTIPHPVIGEHGGGRVLLRPASPGTGLIAGGGVRAVVEAAGIKDVLAKSLGSNNHTNVVKATLAALDQLRTKEEIYALRGKRVAEKQAL